MSAALTFDLDWAPEWCIENCIKICREAGVKATFFVTHPSAALRSIASDPQFELGIHPNFLNCSDHGRTTKEVMDHCLSLVPDAKSMRTHALVQSTHILAEISDDYPGIETDVSLLLPLHRGLYPTDIYLGRLLRRFTRLPYFWEDDVMAVWPGWNWSVVPQTDGLAIYDFHPVFVALNISTMKGYEQIKNMQPPRPLYERTPEDFAPHTERGSGSGTFLKTLIASRPSDAFVTIAEITGAYRAGSR